jgi:hypothetical protein
LDGGGDREEKQVREIEGRVGGKEAEEIKGVEAEGKDIAGKMERKRQKARDKGEPTEEKT